MSRPSPIMTPEERKEVEKRFVEMKNEWDGKHRKKPNGFVRFLGSVLDKYLEQDRARHIGSIDRSNNTNYIDTINHYHYYSNTSEKHHIVESSIEDSIDESLKDI